MDEKFRNDFYLVRGNCISLNDIQLPVANFNWHFHFEKMEIGIFDQFEDDAN